MNYGIIMAATIIFADGSKKMARNNIDHRCRRSVIVDADYLETLEEAFDLQEAQIKDLKRWNASLNKHVNESREIIELFRKCINILPVVVRRLLSDDAIELTWKILESSADKAPDEYKDEIRRDAEDIADIMFHVRELAIDWKSDFTNRKKQQVLARIPGIAKIVIVNEAKAS